MNIEVFNNHLKEGLVLLVFSSQPSLLLMPRTQRKHHDLLPKVGSLIPLSILHSFLWSYLFIICQGICMSLYANTGWVCNWLICYLCTPDRETPFLLGLFIELASSICQTIWHNQHTGRICMHRVFFNNYWFIVKRQKKKKNDQPIKAVNSIFFL